MLTLLVGGLVIPDIRRPTACNFLHYKRFDVGRTMVCLMNSWLIVRYSDCLSVLRYMTFVLQHDYTFVRIALGLALLTHTWAPAPRAFPAPPCPHPHPHPPPPHPPLPTAPTPRLTRYLCTLPTPPPPHPHPHPPCLGGAAGRGRTHPTPTRFPYRCYCHSGCWCAS